MKRTTYSPPELYEFSELNHSVTRVPANESILGGQASITVQPFTAAYHGDRLHRRSACSPPSSPCLQHASNTATFAPVGHRLWPTLSLTLEANFFRSPLLPACSADSSSRSAGPDRPGLVGGSLEHQIRAVIYCYRLAEPVIGFRII